MDSLIQLEKHLYSLENELLCQDSRTDPPRLTELIDDDFCEVGASGKMWSKQGAISALQTEIFVVREIADFKVRLLSPGVALATYRCRRHATETKAEEISLRSSIWKRDKRDSGFWRIVFHQGTATSSDAR